MIQVAHGEKYYVVDMTLDGIHVLDDAIPSFKELEKAEYVAELLRELNPEAKVVVSEYTWVAPVIQVYSTVNEYLIPDTVQNYINSILSSIPNPYLRQLSLANLKNTI